MIYSNRPGFCSDGTFNFAVYFDTDTLLGRQLSILLTNNDKPIYAVNTDFVSKMYIIRTKIHDQNKNAVGAKTRSLWELSFLFFLLPKRFAVNWKTRRNATRQSYDVLVT